MENARNPGLLGCMLSLCLSSVIVCANAAVAVGDAVPEINLPPLDSGTPSEGEYIRLADYLGKVVYLDFWASWCPPCLRSLPQLNQLRQALQAQGFEVFAINVDEDRAAALEFLHRLPISYPVVYDGSGVTPAQFDFKGMPTAFLIDRAGIVRYIHEGFRQGDIHTIRQLVERLLENPEIDSAGDSP